MHADPTVIRPATPADAADIAALQSRFVAETLVTFTTITPTQAQWEEDLLKGDAKVVAYRAARFCGFAALSRFRAGPGYAHVREVSIYLVERVAGQGIGAELLRAIEAAAKTQGVEILVAAISSANPRAEAFFARHGYGQTGRMPGLGQKWGQRLDLVLCQKFLVSQEGSGPDMPTLDG